MILGKKEVKHMCISSEESGTISRRVPRRNSTLSPFPTALRSGACVPSIGRFAELLCTEWERLIGSLDEPDPDLLDQLLSSLFLDPAMETRACDNLADNVHQIEGLWGRDGLSRRRRRSGRQSGDEATKVA